MDDSKPQQPKKRQEGEEKLTAALEAAALGVSISKAPSLADTAKEDPPTHHATAAAAKSTHPATIGIIGLSPIQVARLEIKIVEAANHLDCKRDDQVPPMVGVGIPITEEADLVAAAQFCAVCGADVIAVCIQRSSKVTLEKIKASLPNKKITILTLDGEGEAAEHELARATVRISLEGVTEPTRPDLVYTENTTEPEIKQRIEEDLLQKIHRFNELKKLSPIDILDLPLCVERVTIIVGGAGPRASAHASQYASELGVPYVHFCETQAPGKLAWHTGQGPTYFWHYQTLFQFIAHLFKGRYLPKIIIPCNTAHKGLIYFCPQDMLPLVIDIRNIIRNIKETNIFLIGTNVTTGVGLASQEVGAYEEYNQKQALGKTFILPTLDQQRRINEAIFQIKAGNMTDSQATIFAVIAEMRDAHPSIRDNPVILGCTELPLVVTAEQAMATRLAIPTDRMVRSAAAVSSRLRSDLHSEASAAQHRTPSSPEVSSSDVDSPIPRRRDEASAPFNMAIFDTGYEQKEGDFSIYFQIPETQSDASHHQRSFLRYFQEQTGLEKTHYRLTSRLGQPRLFTIHCTNRDNFVKLSKFVTDNNIEQKPRNSLYQHQPASVA